jgi:cell division transport system permease protein
MTTLWRMFKFGLQGFTRNIWLSVVTILIVVLNLFLMSLVSGLNIVGQQTLSAVRQKVNLSVYFTATTSESRVNEVRQDLLKLPDVQSIRLVSRAEHLDQLKKAKPEVSAAIDALGDNPLGAGLVISAKTLDGYGAIAKALKADQYKTIIENTGNDFSTNQTVISRLSLIVKKVQTASYWLTALFAVIAVLMVFNTIRVAIYSQREEIGIMKLVGASDAFVRGPFVVTSIIYGLIAALAVTGILIPLLTIINPKLQIFFAGYDINVLSYVRANFWAILGLEVVIGCALSAVSSLFAIGRYLRV